MNKPHLELCPGCYQRTLSVHLTESKDVLYCERCGHEGERVLAQPRRLEPVGLSVRERGAPAKPTKTR